MRTQFAIRVLAALMATALAAPVVLAQSDKTQPQRSADLGIELGLWDVLIAGRPDIRPALSDEQKTRLEHAIQEFDADRYRQLQRQIREYLDATAGKRPTDDEQKALAGVRKDLNAMLKELRDKVTAILTPAQRTYLFSPYGRRASGLITGVLRSAALTGEQKAKLEGLRQPPRAPRLDRQSRQAPVPSDVPGRGRRLRQAGESRRHRGQTAFR